MFEIIEEYLSDTYRFDNGDVIDISTNEKVLFFIEVEKSISAIFDIDKKEGGVITFNWLLNNGIQLIKKNWNTMYAVRNKESTEKYLSTIKEGADFNYKTLL